MRQRHFDLQPNQLYTEIATLLGVPRDEIGPDVSLQHDLGIDSLDTVELVEALEQDFGIRIPDDDFALIETVADLERCLIRAH